MHVDNIFELVNKFSKEEDQISASFGFILKNNRKILQKFLNEINIDLKSKEGNSSFSVLKPFFFSFFVFGFREGKKIGKILLQY